MQQRDYRVKLTRISGNAKTGPIPVSTTERYTCPTSCGMKDVCYASIGPLKLHWDAVSSGGNSIGWDEFCGQIQALPLGQLWRHNQAGDLPGDGVHIDGPALYKLVQANKGRRGFTYTHYPLTTYNIACIEAANIEGFVIIVSCDSLEQCDTARLLTTAPLAVVLHSEEKRKLITTPQGMRVLTCAAALYEDKQCVNCQWCADPSQDIAIGFPAHGAKKKYIDIKLEII